MKKVQFTINTLGGRCSSPNITAKIVKSHHNPSSTNSSSLVYGFLEIYTFRFYFDADSAFADCFQGKTFWEIIRLCFRVAFYEHLAYFFILCLAPSQSRPSNKQSEENAFTTSNRSSTSPSVQTKISSLGIF